MRDLKNKLTSSKNSKNIQSRRGKSFGYQVLGFGSGETPITLTGDFDYLLIAGGSAGGTAACGTSAGGGGAGGYLESFCTPGTPAFSVYGDISVIIGAGGSAAIPVGSNNTGGVNSTIVDGLGTTITGIGGGLGAGRDIGPTTPIAGQSGGSGGGGIGGRRSPAPTINAGASLCSQGNAGGSGSYNCAGAPSGGRGAGGGGGAGSVGNAASQGGPGGNGKASSITNSPVTRAGGGGGGNYAIAGGGTGGPGGGGTGGDGSPGQGCNGTVNLGGGGGGGGSGGDSCTNSGTGGSGVAYLRYPTSITGTISPGTNTIACAPCSTKVATFTVSGSLTF